MKESKKKLTTSILARAVKCHPNTVRLYEKWGYLEPIPRAKNGYRVYSEKHLQQMRLARIALPGPYPGGGTPVYQLVREAAKGHFNKALKLAKQYQNNVQQETINARSVLKDLEKWAHSSKYSLNRPLFFSRRKAAQALCITIDTLRTWERNGLLRVEKNELGYCKYSERDISRLKIIFALRSAGYSIASIHKMFLEYDSGTIKNISRKILANILNTPAPDAPIVYVTDMWLTTLAEHRKRAAKIIRLLISMNKKI